MQVEPLLRGGSGALEEVLRFDLPVLARLLLGGLLVLGSRLRPLGVAAWTLLLLGLLAERASQPWELVGWMPGMSAADCPARLQWTLLVFGRVGLAGLLWLPRRRDRGRLLL